MMMMTMIFKSNALLLFRMVSRHIYRLNLNGIYIFTQFVHVINNMQLNEYGELWQFVFTQAKR